MAAYCIILVAELLSNKKCTLLALSGIIILSPKKLECSDSASK